jgi:hypothetical protein
MKINNATKQYGQRNDTAGTRNNSRVINSNRTNTTANSDLRRNGKRKADKN